MSKKKLRRYKCYACDGISNTLGWAKDFQGGDYLRCLLCGAIEPGFEEVEEEEEDIS